MGTEALHSQAALFQALTFGCGIAAGISLLIWGGTGLQGMAKGQPAVLVPSPACIVPGLQASRCSALLRYGAQTQQPFPSQL